MPHPRLRAFCCICGRDLKYIGLEIKNYFSEPNKIPMRWCDYCADVWWRDVDGLPAREKREDEKQKPFCPRQ
jgi:hypothetical protein